MSKQKKNERGGLPLSDRQWTKRQLLDYIEAAAGRFRSDGIETVLRRNGHMHEFKGKFHRKLADAVLLSFCSYIGTEQGLDEDFSLKYLEEETEKANGE